MRSSVAALASCWLCVGTHALSTPAKGFSEIGGTSSLTRGLVSSLTVAVNALGGKGAEPAAARVREFDLLTGDAVLEGLRRDFVDKEYLWSGQITPELYDESCVFTDPTLSFCGLSTFEANLENLDPWINRFVPAENRKVELYSLKLVDEGCTIEANWRMIGDLALPWRPRLDLNGRTRYTLEGDGGRISAYDEAWAITPSQALLQLVKPYKPMPPPGSPIEGARAMAAASEAEATQAADSFSLLNGQSSIGDIGALLESSPKSTPGAGAVEHWSGRLDGALPPKPRVILREAPPYVILPGFGNAAVDYTEPLQQPEEVGLAAALGRRGVDSVSVVPIERSDWLNVLRGALDINFLRNTAQPDGPVRARRRGSNRDAETGSPMDTRCLSRLLPVAQFEARAGQASGVCQRGPLVASSLETTCMRACCAAPSRRHSTGICSARRRASRRHTQRGSRRWHRARPLGSKATRVLYWWGILRAGGSRGRYASTRRGHART